VDYDGFSIPRIDKNKSLSKNFQYNIYPACGTDSLVGLQRRNQSHGRSGTAPGNHSTGLPENRTCDRSDTDISELAVSPVTSPTAPAPANQPGKQRVYYIAAVEVEWDYAPSNMNQITGQPFGDRENVFVAHSPSRIGKVYTKAVYREYTDDSFTTQKPIAPEWQHLGILGPAIHAEVGDQIIVHFKNLTRFPASMHPHGVLYKKDSEGAQYNDQTNGNDKTDDSVPTQGTHTYIWDVPERAGPGPMDPRSIMWMYHSHVDEPGDTNAGLMGPIIISARGNAKPDGMPKDVDREFVVTFSVMDENISPYLDSNIETKTTTPAKELLADSEFGESNLMHSINGYVYGNLPGLIMKKGERVRWYVMAMGTEVDLHTPHWHGNVITYMGSQMDVIELLPASMKVVDMLPDNPGVWMLHCHVNDHIIAGMQALYTVQP
jgi:manganese oxidase